MKKILAKKISISFVFSVLMIACSAPVCFSDSFVNEGVLNALKDFKFGGSASKAAFSDQAIPDSMNQFSLEGDSFVDAAALESLKDFRLGASDHSGETMIRDCPPTPMITGDSFVDAEVLNRWDWFVSLKGIDPEMKQVAGQADFFNQN